MFGLDAAGTVVSVGRSVKDFKEGDRVYVNPGLSCGSCKQCLAGLPTRCASYTFMGYFGFSPSSKEVFREYRHAGDAQYLRAPARNLITLADDLPFEVATRLGYLGTAYSALKKLELTPGKSLLILGASGTLGIGATLAAVAMGVTDVIAPMSYTELSVEERVTIQISHAQGFSLRRIACLINRSPSTISRELRRNRDVCGGYSAHAAQQQMQARRQVCRPKRKLLRGGERFELVAHMLRERLSPEQIAGKLRSMNIPSLRDAYVCRETINNAIYALPVGELRRS